MAHPWEEARLREAEASKELLCEHEHLGNEAWVQAARMAPMHIVDWGEAKEVDPMLAAYRRWLHTCKDTPFPKRCIVEKVLGYNTNTEEGWVLFHICNGLVMSKGLLYVSTTPKGEAEGILAFLVPTSQCLVALNGVHCDMGHQGQQRMLALTQESFWWPMMVEDYQVLVRGCQWWHVFEGAIPKALLCPIRTHVPLELVHIDFTSVELTMDLNKPPCILYASDHQSLYTLCIGSC